MFSFARRAIEDAITFFSVYFIILYSLGVTLIYLTLSLGDSLPTLLLLILVAGLILYLRKVFQQQLQMTYKRYAVDFASSLLTRFTLSFSLSVYLFSLLVPEFRQNFIKLGGLETNLAVHMAKYVIAAVVGVIFATIILSVLGKKSGLHDQQKMSGSSVIFSVAGILLISTLGPTFSGAGRGWYGIPEAVLEQVGYFCFGSLPLLQMRLLFLGRDLNT